MEIEQLMSADFVAFSQKIAELYTQREEKSTQFKELYLKHKADLADIEKQVRSLKEEFESKTK